jgi:hypothetical protein
VPHGFEPFQRFAPHPLRGRFGSYQRGVSRLQGLQFAHQPVVIGIRNGRFVKDVVTVVVLFYLGAKFGGAAGGLLGNALLTGDVQDLLRS